MTLTLLNNKKVIEKCILLTAIFFVVLPFFVVQYVPATDLPQHLAQIRLLFEALSNPQQNQYNIHFFDANVLVYWILLAHWLLFPPILAGKITMITLVLSWVAAIFFVARKQHGFPLVTLLCSLVIFNASFYWGFINFLVGFPIFIVWYTVVICTVHNSFSYKRAIYIFVLSFVLFFSHALWFAVAVAALAITDVIEKVNFRTILKQTAALFPVTVYAVSWYLPFAEKRTVMGFDTAPHWIVTPLGRLHPSWIVDSVFGGLKGPLEWLLLIGIIVWIIIVVATNKNGLWSSINKRLLYISLMLFVMIYTFPDKYINTIYFASRWYPIAIIFFLVSLPLPKIPNSLAFIFAFFFLFTFSLTTTLMWHRFEVNEQSGLTEALQKIPSGTRVLGLDYLKESSYIKGRPFIQTFAYAQVLHSANIGFSFAEHSSGIITKKYFTGNYQWTPGIEWFAEFAKYEDMKYFDYALVGAYENLHTEFRAANSPLEVITTQGVWRLYKCKADKKLKGPILRFLYYQNSRGN